jgi:hypothetical protein
MQGEEPERQALVYYDIISLITGRGIPDFTDERHKKLLPGKIWENLIRKYAEKAKEGFEKYKARSAYRSENGKKGGAPKGNKNAKRKDEDTEEEPTGEDEDDTYPPSGPISDDTKSSFSNFTFGDVRKTIAAKKLTYLNPAEIWEKIEAAKCEIENLEAYLVASNKNAKDEAEIDSATFNEGDAPPSENEFYVYAGKLEVVSQFAARKLYQALDAAGWKNNGHKVNWRKVLSDRAEIYRELRTREGLIAFCKKNGLNINVKQYLADCIKQNWHYTKEDGSIGYIIDPYVTLPKISDSNNSKNINARDF